MIYGMSNGLNRFSRFSQKVVCSIKCPCQVRQLFLAVGHVLISICCFFLIPADVF